MNYKVIIPAAGKATRLKPLSSSMSKSMVPVNGKPIISYIIDELFKIGNPTEIVIVENELGDIQDFVKKAYGHLHEESRIKFATQKERLGPLHAIEIGALKLNNDPEPIMVWLGDTICLELEEIGKESFLVTSPVKDYSRWCLVDNENNFYDKPDTRPPTNQTLIGIYYFHNNKSFYASLDNGMNAPMIKDEHQISSLLEDYKKTYKFKLIETDQWYDCGELHTFYDSKARLLSRSARSFNQLTVNTFHNTVTKSTHDKAKREKIENEKNWFLSLPEEIKIFTPRILESNEGTLIMSQEPGTPLNEMWLYEDLKIDTWKRILDKILQVHNEIFMRQNVVHKSSELDKNMAKLEMYLSKNISRIVEISNLDFVNQDEVSLVREFISNTAEELFNKNDKWSKYFHGDSHMGNILFEPLQGSIKFVDPRGKFGNIIGTEGDMYYDMAKIAQDYILRYPELLAGHFSLKFSNLSEQPTEVEFYRDHEKSREMIRHLTKRLSEYEYDVELVYKLACVLIFTCIPFHSDSTDRQHAFWIYTLKIIKENNWI